jgi:hypothetical protein
MLKRFFRLKSILVILINLTCCILTSYAQQTIISGLVLDIHTKEPLPFADVIFKNTQIGVSTDEMGRFELITSDLSLERITVSYTGYDSRNVQITPGITQRATIELKPENFVLLNIDIVAEKKIKKDTAAITLFRNVIKHKPDNAPKTYDNYAYQNYSKTIFGLYDVSEKFKTRIIVRKLPFVFDNVDTIPETKTTILPGLMKETFKYLIYRNDPKREKEVLLGDKFSGVTNTSISDLVEFNYEDVDVYGSTINVNGKPIMSPFADNATLNYKYFLTDTQNIDGYLCYQLQFTGRSTKDNAFSGSAWIHDTTFAIKEIELTLLPQSNINFISYFQLLQKFIKIDDKYWFKNYESYQTNLNVFKSDDKQSFMVTKDSWRTNIVINNPALDSLVEGDSKVIFKGAREQNEEFWQQVRYQPLTYQESKVDSTAEEVLDSKIIKRMSWILDLLRTRYLGAGPIDIGQVDQMYSYNALEGSRIKFGFRTANELTDKILVGGHFAYGLKDDAYKYGAYTRIPLRQKNELWHMLGGGYRYDYSFIEYRDSDDVHDNILNTILQKTPIDNIFLTKLGNIFYERDWIQGLTTKLEFARREFISIPGRYDFDVDNTGIDGAGFTATELEFNLAYAKKARFYKSSSDFTRSSPITNNPKLNFNYKVGINNFLGSNVGYHRLEATLSHKLLSPIGITKYAISAGKIFGALPYPLLELHRGNESIYFESRAYNVMNNFEFVSDAYASFWFEHHFEGLVLNKIPGIKYLQLRSILYYKMLVGKLDKKNESVIPLLDELKPLNGYYMELGFGVENILKLLRVDFIWRLTQREQPDVQKWGVRFLISPKF